MGRIVGRAVLAFLVAAVIAYALTIGIGLVLMEHYDVSQLEGANAMGLVFMIGPAIAILSGLVAAIWTGLKTSASAGNAPPRAGRLGLQAIGLAIGAILGNAIGTGLRKLLFEGQAFETSLIAYLVAFMPELAMIAGALGGIALARRIGSGAKSNHGASAD
jgi:hypothetical protein